VGGVLAMLPGDVVDSAGCVAGAEAPCCSKATPADPAPNKPDPSRRCEDLCCIKGVPKSFTPSWRPGGDPVVLHHLGSDTLHTQWAGQHVAMWRGEPVHPPPMSLLRLRCALII
jgi:hypothetical protein